MEGPAEVCYACGYSLAGLRGSRCPECAADIRSPALAAAASAQREHRQLLHDLVLIGSAIVLAWLGPRCLMHNNWPWETRVGQLASIAGISLAVCSFARMLWRSMGPWAVGPGVVLGLMFFMGAAVATGILEAIYRALL